MKTSYAFAVLAALVLVGCGSGATEGGTSGGTADKPKDTEKALVVFSQANSQDPWRKVFDAETKAEAEKHAAEFAFDMQDAGGDAAKQNNIIDTFMVRKPKVLLVSPTETSVQTSIEKAFDAGTAVILLDRAIDSEKYTAWIGGDNVDIGRKAGEYVAMKLAGKGTVLMIQGIAQATPTKDRRGGFMEVMAKNPGIKVIEGDDCGYQRQKARSFMETFLQKREHIDCVYAHNDEMAIGARLAWDAGAQNAFPGDNRVPVFVGIDGCQQEVVDMIKDGKLDATFKYPTPGAKGVEVAAEILKGNMPKEKKIVLPTTLVTKEFADQYMKDNPNLAK
ncbi:MAG: substrate-binding domain-containing protein [Armatimonadetes bacterium]|nr:substrate-binding domain-containing protein [Armatimonadota bacterium]